MDFSVSCPNFISSTWTRAVQGEICQEWWLDSRCPSLSENIAGMKNRSINARFIPCEVIAKLGPVQVVKQAENRHKLIGGSLHDQIKVQEWCLEHAPFVRLEEMSGIETMAFAG